MKTINIQCVNDVQKCRENEVVTSGSENYVNVTFSFDESWSEYRKRATFWRNTDDVYPVDIIDNQCIVPREVLRTPGVFFFGVFGEKEGIVRPSTTLRYKIDQGAIAISNAPDPSPTIYELQLKRIELLENNANIDISPELIQSSVNEYLQNNPIVGSPGKKWNKSDCVC